MRSARLYVTSTVGVRSSSVSIMFASIRLVAPVGSDGMDKIGKQRGVAFASNTTPLVPDCRSGVLRQDDTPEGLAARILRVVFELVLDLKQTVVLRRALATGRGARLDLAGVGCHH